MSWRAFGDSKKVTALEKGADIQVKRWEGTVRWFSTNWPADLAWPEGIERPAANEPPENDTKASAA